MMPARVLLVVLTLLFAGWRFPAGLALAAGEGKADGSAGTAGPEAPGTSKGAAPPAKTSGPRLPQPDLVVSDLALDKQCRVVLAIRNDGKGPVPEEEFRRGQIQVTAGERRVLMPLAKADRLGVLKAAGGSVKVDIGLVLDKVAPVQAEVDSTRQIVESDELNNRRSARLTPRCAAAAGKEGGGTDQALATKPVVPKAVVRAAPVAATGTASPGSGPGPGKPPRPAMSKMRLPPPGDKPTPVPLRLDRGILILDPIETAVYYQGETIFILCRFTRDEVTSGTVTFRLMRVGTTGEAATTTGAVTSTVVSPIPLTPRADIPVGEYFVTATHAESGAYGESDIFRIAVNSARIDFRNPERGAVVPPGSDLNLRYQFNRRVQPGTVTFQLFHEGEPVSTQTDEYLPGSAASRGQPIHTVHWETPRDARGEYRIIATHPAATGTSPLFSIQPQSFGDAGPGTPTAWEIRLVTPGRMPVSWPRGSTNVIAWRISGAYPAERSFLVHLTRGGGSVLSIPADEAVWHEPSDSYSLEWTIPADLPPASDYRIRVADRMGPTEGISERDFAVTGPIEVLHGGGTRSIGNPTQIRWRIAPGSAVTRLRVVLLNNMRGTWEEVLTIADNVRTDAGEYVWTVGANHLAGDVWEFNRGSGPPITGRSKVRIYDAADAANFGEGMSFDIEPPDLSVWTSDSSCSFGRRVHWSSSTLHSSARVEVAAIWSSDCRYAGPADLPIDLGYRDIYHVLSAGNRPTGNFCWQFRDTNARYNCDCFPFDHAYVVVSVAGFRYVSMVRSSETFNLTDSGCDRSDPVWEDHGW